MWWARERVVVLRSPRPGASPEQSRMDARGADSPGGGTGGPSPVKGNTLVETSLEYGDLETAVTYLNERVQQLEAMVETLKERNQELEHYKDTSVKLEVMRKEYDKLHAELLEEKHKVGLHIGHRKRADKLEKENQIQKEMLREMKQRIKEAQTIVEKQHQLETPILQSKVKVYEAENAAALEELRIKGEYLKDVCDQQQSFIEEHMTGAIAEIALAKWKTWSEEIKIRDLSFVPKHKPPNLYLFDNAHTWRGTKSSTLPAKPKTKGAKLSTRNAKTAGGDGFLKPSKSESKLLDGSNTEEFSLQDGDVPQRMTKSQTVSGSLHRSHESSYDNFLGAPAAHTTSIDSSLWADSVAGDRSPLCGGDSTLGGPYPTASSLKSPRSVIPTVAQDPSGEATLGELHRSVESLGGKDGENLIHMAETTIMGKDSKEASRVLDAAREKEIQRRKMEILKERKLLEEEHKRLEAEEKRAPVNKRQNLFSKDGRERLAERQKHEFDSSRPRIHGRAGIESVESPISD